MERYAVLHGEDGQNGRVKLAADSGLLDYLTRCGSDNPPSVVQVVCSLLRGFYALEGYGSQPWRNRPVTVRYAPLYLGRRDDMPNHLKPFCALCVSGLDVESGKSANDYDYLVLMDREELLKAGTLNYLDHLFGTHLVSSDDLSRMRRKGKLDCGKEPRKLYPEICREDRNAVYATVEAIFAGKTVVIRLEEGMVFNTRSMDVLSQIYSMLPRRIAVDTGFASYQDPIKIRRIQRETGIRVYVVPGEASLEFLDEDVMVVDLNEPDSIAPSGSLLEKCLKKWGQLNWQDRFETLNALSEKVGANIRDVQVFAKLTSDFFGDPFFQFKPQQPACGTLEELKAAFDRFPVLRYDIGWVLEMMREKAAVLYSGELKLPQMKAEAAAKARTAASAEERKKFTALYRFAQKLDPSDASIHAIVQTEHVVQERLDEQRAEMDKAVNAVRTEWADRLAAQEKKYAALAAEKRAAEEKAASDAKKQKAETESQLRKLREAHSAELKQRDNVHASELQKLRTSHASELQKAKNSQSAASGLQVTQLQKRIEELNRANDAERQKTKKYEQMLSQETENHKAKLLALESAHSEALKKARAGQPAKTGSNLQVENLQKRIRELTDAHAREIAVLKAAHAKELAARPAAGGMAADSESARQVSERAKQIIAAQLLRNLAEIEQLKARHESQLAALKNGNAS